MFPTYDVVVVGLGGMGSAALFHAARRHVRTLGLEQFEIPHDRGSSHGTTRIIRLAYWEHPSYVPLLRRAYDLWRELEQVTSESLLVITGSVDAAAPESRPFRGVRETCRQFRLEHEILDNAALRQRFPGYRLPDALRAVFQPDGGFLLSARSVAAHVKAAEESGATVHVNERVSGWDVRPNELLVHTDRDTYVTRRLIVTAGPWAG